MENAYTIACSIRESYIKNESLDMPAYRKFQERYPKLYAMLQNPNMDAEMFEKLFMIFGQDSSQSGASRFSEFGAEKYLYPQFGRPTGDQLKEAQKKIEKRI
jgi:hypothetical protein